MLAGALVGQSEPTQFHSGQPQNAVDDRDDQRQVDAVPHDVVRGDAPTWLPDGLLRLPQPSYRVSDGGPWIKLIWRLEAAGERCDRRVSVSGGCRCI